MSPSEEVQYASLVISILVVISMTVLALNRKSARIFYASMISGWVPGIIYYIVVLFFNDSIISETGVSASHLSAQLRLYQYFVFGAWFILDATDISLKHISEKIKSRKMKKREQLNQEWEGDIHE